MTAAVPNIYCRSTHRCYCCGRPAREFLPLILSDKGWVCAHDDFCRAGTSVAASPTHREAPESEDTR